LFGSVSPSLSLKILINANYFPMYQNNFFGFGDVGFDDDIYTSILSTFLGFMHSGKATQESKRKHQNVASLITKIV
jgi:hypothetical protein